MKNRLKLLAMILLLASMVLPQFTCTNWVGPDGTTVGARRPGGDSAASYQRVVERHYALETYHPADWRSWAIVLVFLWPIPLVVYHLRRRPARAPLAVTLLEVVLALGSGYVVFAISSLGTRAIGGYLGLAGNALYLVSLLPLERKT